MFVPCLQHLRLKKLEKKKGTVTHLYFRCSLIIPPPYLPSICLFPLQATELSVLQ